ncbi:hypothetical protein K7H91_24755 [Martelella mediterranea]|uniref:hypothetical protein n=1 Tax=Martelella mediterranea TaxID=293089 RepID=UPI001E5D6770|nr:hypothetical protein [Martelella mediterranea]MCD1636962.1 hypothetical protein [Martelella mediterranea]
MSTSVISRTLGAAIAFAFAAAAAFGMLRNYTPVPFWDMWPGIVYFYSEIHGGVYSAFWEQHMSHRLVFSNILFYLDQQFFGGINIFLFCVDFLLMALIPVWFWSVMRLAPRFSWRNPMDFGILMLICVISFSWIQWRNIIWAYQSQMYATILLPATSFLLLYHAGASTTAPKQSNRLFMSAIVLGFCSAFTMMNGILALPLMVVLSLVWRLSTKRVLICLAATAIVLALFFAGYSKTEYETPFLGTLLDHPRFVFTFIFTQLGSPVFYVLGEERMSAALLCGFAIALGLVIMGIRLIVKAETRQIGVLLAAAICYSTITIAAIATGRYDFGADQAVESRYMTNVLFIWSLFSLLLWFNLRSDRKYRRVVYGFMALLTIGLSSYQFKAIAPLYAWPRLDQNVGALAVELGVPDRRSIGFIYPDTEDLFELSERARELRSSIFGLPLYEGLREKLGSHHAGALEGAAECILREDTFRLVAEQPEYAAISGVLFSPKLVRYPERFTVLSSDGIVLGYALTERSVFAPFQNPETNATWVKGLFQVGEAGDQITLASDTYNCFIQLPDSIR